MDIKDLLNNTISSLNRDGVIATFRRIRNFTKNRLTIPLKALPSYESEYQANYDFSEYSTSIKPIAFYLPQFHTIPENDDWWGKGYTEWTNARKALPRFSGHYQPRLPHRDFGFYDLKNIESYKKQVVLAKQHGIYGFCWYYYWFSGKKLLDQPLESMLRHPEIDFPFCLCWANENWTRKWDGQNENVLMSQGYSAQDSRKFIEDLLIYVMDKRYIRIHGKPVILIYNAGEVPTIKSVINSWRRYAKEYGMGDIYVLSCRTCNNTSDLLDITCDIDGEVEFPPHNTWDQNAYIKIDIKDGTGFTVNYPTLVDNQIEHIQNDHVSRITLFRSIMLGWDNSPRRENGWFVYCRFTLKDLYRWVTAICDKLRSNGNKDEQFFFINAWNEWTEGTYLEPDEQYGYASINTISRAIYQQPFPDSVKVINDSSKVINMLQPKIAVHAHIYYTDCAREIITMLDELPYPYHLFVTTDTDKKHSFLQDLLKDKFAEHEITIITVQNRGRDVAPFLVDVLPYIDQYDYVLHIHSKKTAWSAESYGDFWREYLFQHLVGNKAYLQRLFAFWENHKEIGLVFPDTYPVVEKQAGWGGNEILVNQIFSRIGIKISLSNTAVFPAGNMFWARTDALKCYLSGDFRYADFPAETGQTNLTLAHAMERTWVYALAANGYTYQKVFNACNKAASLKTKKRLAIFAHYNKDSAFSNDDLKYLAQLQKCSSDICVVSNSPLYEEDRVKLSRYTQDIIVRENNGFDFSAWRDAMLFFGWERILQYDELLLANNSCVSVRDGLQYVFSNMDESNNDFWGITVFPGSTDGTYIQREKINRHIQSYFLVFRNAVFSSSVFQTFWEQLKDQHTIIQTIANCENELTVRLEHAGFHSGVFIKESGLMCQSVGDWSLLYTHPYGMLLLNCPFVKKKSSEYVDEHQKKQLDCLCKQLNNLD